MANCYQPDSCWDRNQVNVCWYPRVMNNTSTMAYNPGGGYNLTSIPAGAMVCLQSTRNPSCVDGQPSTPPLRGANSGYYWGYYRDAGGNVYTGWINGGDIGGGAGGPCSGPAFADFQCGGNAVGCTDSAGGCSDRNDNWTLNAAAYIRYAPGSTAYYWCANGASVNRRAYANNGYACVTVTNNGKFCPNGTVGWIEQSALS